MRRARHGYTVVQHAGYNQGNNPQFARGLQSVPLADEAQRAAVLRVGGVVFDRYQEAETWANREQYPVGYFDVIPIAQGRFVDELIGGLRLYLPPGE